MASTPPADRRHLLDRFREEADTPRPFAGEVPERLKGLVSKTSVGLVLTVGSNPTLSASRASRDQHRGSRCFAERPLAVRQAITPASTTPPASARPLRLASLGTSPGLLRSPGEELAQRATDVQATSLA